ncbi:MAG: GPW/gp25 family protein [Lachnospiraceae bacterium]|nr:GPW/gp25 family protein [Lachnospiraceae bacterium]
MDIVINSEENYEQNFQENDTVRSVIQNIALLLNTKKGTIPMYREFGLPMNFIDKPINVAETMATLEITEALRDFEPRAKLKNLEINKNANGKAVIIVEVTV